MSPFNVISRRFTQEILSRKNLQNFASKVANWIIVDILKYFYVISSKLGLNYYSLLKDREWIPDEQASRDMTM